MWKDEGMGGWPSAANTCDTCSFYLEENRHRGPRFYIVQGFGFAAKAVRRLCAFLSIPAPWNDGE